MVPESEDGDSVMRIAVDSMKKFLCGTGLLLYFDSSKDYMDLCIRWSYIQLNTQTQTHQIGGFSLFVAAVIWIHTNIHKRKAALFHIPRW